jgi:FkbM family methyltransferase
MAQFPRWMIGDRQGSRPKRPPGAKLVRLGGVETVLEGAADDPYFQGVEQHALGLDGLAALVAAQVPQASTVVDVGANIGLSTILLARSVQRVIAFEPSPANLEYLRRNLASNGITNVEVVAAAVSDRPSTLRFHVAQFGAGSHVVAAGHVLSDGIATIEVPAVTLDGALTVPVSFIKIDAEGHEPDVLAGARAVLDRDKPMIYTEINVWCLSAFAGHSPGAFVRTLFRAFDVGTPQPDGTVVPLPDGYGFLHDLIVHNKGMADIVLRPRPNVAMPSLPELAWPEPAVAALNQAGPHSRPM